MLIKTGLANYAAITIEKWTMDDSDLNIGHQISEFVNNHSENEDIPEMKVAFVGDFGESSKAYIAATLMLFPDRDATLLVAINAIEDKDTIKAIASMIIDKLKELADSFEDKRTEEEK
jgi:hypothetical protein